MADHDENARVIVQQWISLDGFSAGPTDEMDIMSVVDDEADARSQTYNQRFLDDAATVMLGRRTYLKFSQYWPTATEPIASRVNAIPKIVASQSLEAAPWGDHEPAAIVEDAVDYVRSYRAGSSGPLVVWGSLDLTKSLLDADQVDELDLFVAPVWLGEGTRLLASGTGVRLAQSASDDWGTITHLRYRIDR